MQAGFEFPFMASSLAVLFIGGLLVSLGFLFWAGSSGTAWWKSVPKEHLHFPVSADFGWYEVLIFYPIIVGLPYLVGPDIYSRILCTRSQGVAKKSALVAAGAVIPLSFLLARNARFQKGSNFL